ncbi:MAG: hypothetical protein A3J83_05200 [Elusimicrobia bacterium RIFOXYA2_FULL_40_6]|nr:MAG: hypothetical protein A3J83_05200 [Elusimicrobia bacterium RIFOXYA2_FULL_40_6]
MDQKTVSLVFAERIEHKILVIRGKQVILDNALAKLYGVTTGNLNKAVQRNLDRFPEDFMFKLTQEEYDSLRFQFGILKRGEHSKYCPNAFTEQGVAMLSSVLRSKRAAQINIQIMRVFTRLRHILEEHHELRNKIQQHDKQISAIFQTLEKSLFRLSSTKDKIGFSK